MRLYVVLCVCVKILKKNFQRRREDDGGGDDDGSYVQTSSWSLCLSKIMILVILVLRSWKTFPAYLMRSSSSGASNSNPEEISFLLPDFR